MHEVVRVAEVPGIDLREKALKLIVKWIRLGFYYVDLDYRKNAWAHLYKSCPDAEDERYRQYLNSTTTWDELEFFLEEIEEFDVYG